MTSRRYTLFLLTCYFAIAHMDRHIITITLEPIRQEFGLTDLQLGLLSGFAFAVFFSLLIMPFAVAATRINHRNLIASTIGLWSVMTLLTGLAQSYVQLLLTRIGIGIGEAGALPTSHAVISHQYPPDKRATAMSIFMSGANIGLALALIIGGFITQKFGWRFAMFTVGMPGLFLALVIRLTFPPTKTPAKIAVTFVKNRSITLQTISLIWNNLALRYLMIGATLSSITTFGIGAWLPSFLIRTHGISLIHIGLLLALGVGVIGTVGVQLVGRLSDHWAKRNPGWIVWVPALALLASKPFAVFGFLTQNPLTALLAMAVPVAIGNTYIASTVSVLHTNIPAINRPVASALLLLCINLIGMGFGPLIVGLLSDYWRTSGHTLLTDNSLAAGLVAVQLFAIIGALFYIVAGRSLNTSRA